ncbi:DUF3883 domain-containing protein [Leptospira biflexa]|uniref:protein NO VEIN domain-containing protein n=1 Tax=Leptospira biflexa TaxID=172 RepID=UPI001090DB4D|nr:DUF3883 domain-containing protein [Leptospira biflexa]TGM57464.1 DUF3883 domain-containing protein [Leptospira biflexa]
MKIYKTPAKYYFRLHHVRPRFKNNVENVIIYVASIVAKIGKMESENFRELMLTKLKEFPGNVNLEGKTLQNWRTEIAALFGLYFEDSKFTFPSLIAIDLYENQDLTKFFKYFLYSFQYPGGHIKINEVKKIMENKICFNPARYFLSTIYELEKLERGNGYLTKGEACHVIFNDVRATTDKDLKNVKKIASLILSNRKNKCTYDLAGDTIRYAGDILDYLVLSNLLKDFGGKFFLNKTERKSILKFLKNDTYFNLKEELFSNSRKLEEEWVKFVSEPISRKIFATDVLAFFAQDEKEYSEILKRTNYVIESDIPSSGARTKDIGDFGENVIYGHECTYLKINRREDLISIVKCIPNHFAVGYDIQSIDINEFKKYIEVKTTVSSKKLTFNKFHLTKNELGSAQTLKENYFIYRLQVIKGDKAEDKVKLNLRVINNPIELYKRDLIDIDLSSGEVTLRKYQGEDVEVLTWK